MRPNLLLCAALCSLAACAATLPERDAESLALQAEKGDVQAGETLEKHAKAGDPVAQRFMGAMYSSRARRAAQRRVRDRVVQEGREQGDLLSMHDLAVIYARAPGKLRNTGEALKWFRAAAEKGYARSQANLAYMLIEGDGTAQDLPQAKSWLDKAVAQHEPFGEFLLGKLYRDGRGVDKDTARGARLIGLAADAGLREAQFELALMYHDGAGVEKSDDKARELLRKSAEQALSQRGIRARHGVPPGRAGHAERPGQVAASGCGAARTGISPRPSSSSASPYANGDGVKKDARQAYAWMLEAAKNGSPEAKEFVKRVRSRRK